MPKYSRVANHLRYFRSNGIVIVASFILVVAAGFVGHSLTQVGSNVLAEQANGYWYERHDSQNDSKCHGNYYYGCGETRSPHPTYSPSPTPYPTHLPYPTYSPHPTTKPDPNYICTWMKATISDRTVTLQATGNIGSEARIVGYTYDFGDGYVTSGSGSTAHTYTNYATYNTKAWIKYTYYGKQYVSAPCTLIVKVLQPSQPTPTHTPHPTYAPVETYQPKHKDKNNGSGIVNNNTNNNNSSATANVIIQPGVATSGSTVSTAGYSASAPSNSNQTPIELPETGADQTDAIINYVGVGGVVAAGSAYAMSRRELMSTVFKRN